MTGFRWRVLLLTAAAVGLTGQQCATLEGGLPSFGKGGDDANAKNIGQLEQEMAVVPVVHEAPRSGVSVQRGPYKGKIGNAIPRVALEERGRPFENLAQGSRRDARRFSRLHDDLAAHTRRLEAFGDALRDRLGATVGASRDGDDAHGGPPGR